MPAALWLALLLPGQTVWAAKGQPAAPIPVIAVSPQARSGNTTLTIPLEAPLAPPDDGLRPRPIVAVPLAPRRLPDNVVQAALAREAAREATRDAGMVRPTEGRIEPVTTVVNLSPVPASSSAPVQRTSSGVQLRVILPARVAQGQPIPCEIVVQTGDQALAGVEVEAPMPPYCRVLSSEPPLGESPRALRWVLGTLPAQTTRSLKVELLPMQGTEVRLQPFARFTPIQVPRTEIVLPPLGFRVEAPETVALGEVLTVRLHLQNNTPNTLRRIRLACQLPEGLLHAQGQELAAELPNDLPPGQSRTEELALRAQAGGAHRLQLQIQADGGVRTEQRTQIVVQAPVVSLQVQSPRRVRAGEEFSVRLLVANPARQATPPLRIFLPLPAGVELVSAGQKGQMHPAGACLYWTLDPLAGESHVAVTATLRGRTGGDWALTGVVQGPGIRDVRGTQAVLVEEAPKLTVELTRLDDNLTLDGETYYTLRVYNPGPHVAHHIQPFIDLPPELLPVQAEGPAHWRITGQRVLFESLARLPARMDASFQVRVRAVRSGTGIVRGAITAHGLPGSMHRELSARVK